MTWDGRRTIPFLLALGTAIPIAALGWLGVRVLDQDRALEGQRRRESLEFAAGRLALAIERRLGDVEEQLGEAADIRFTKAGISPGLLYQPIAVPPEDTLASFFSAGEQLEFERQDLPNAEEAYRRLAESPQTGLRAAALVRLARVLRKRGKQIAALDAYAQLQRLGPIPVSGQPSELVARQGRCRVLAESGDAERLRNEVSDLARALHAGGWRIDRATFDLYQGMVQQWGGPPTPTDALSRTEAAVALWRNWSTGGLPTRGRRILPEGHAPVLAVWAGAAVWLATSTELEAKLGPLWSAQQLLVSLRDPDGQPFLGSPAPGSIALTPAETRLPFIVNVASSSLAERDDYRMRRVVLIGGLLLTITFTLAAGYGLYRATSREMALARQQADFVSAVSHEFRTPLTSMRHLTELLASRGVRDEDRKAQYYDLLAHETERLHRMVESLLSFGRIQAGAYAWRLESADTSELVRGIVDEFRQDQHARGREVLCEIEDELPPIRADREALARALWNLLENAAKYSEPRTPIRVFARRDGSAILVGVEDHGTGISHAEQKHIFQQFVRGEEAKSAGVRGVGIGLALVKRIVEAHGGSVQLTSEPGRGSTFVLVLPCPAS